jgi:Leucine-rich repeat (LRR) protein
MPETARHHFLTALAMALAALSAGCGQYDVTFNDRLVYTPAPLFTDFEIDDPALADCLRQTIADGKVTAPEQLTVLACSHAGISSLKGLEQFTGLTRIKLDSNRIDDISPLLALELLEVVLLDGNRLSDVQPLLRLPALQRLSLTENPGLVCPESAGVPASLDLVLPAHCSGAEPT